MREAGVELAWFHPVRWWLTPFLRPKLNLRSHRKIVVCDGRVGFTGGINITDDENERVNPNAYHDLHLRFEGESVRWLQIAWLEDWHYATEQKLDESDVFAPSIEGPICTQVLPSGPDNLWEPIHRVHVEAIHRAERRVWLATPYFVPSGAALFALGGAAMRGLDVRLLLPARSDSWLVDASARSYFERLQKTGVRIYLYGPRMLHAKSLLVDDELAVIGSANFDSRSFRLNFELSVLFCDKGVAADLERILGADLAASHEAETAPQAVFPAAPWRSGCSLVLANPLGGRRYADRSRNQRDRLDCVGRPLQVRAMAWILLLLAAACFLVPFFTTSFALGVACMLVALVLVVTAMLLLLAARVGGATRNVRALSSEELRVLREQVEPGLVKPGWRAPVDAADDSADGSPPASV